MNVLRNLRSSITVALCAASLAACMSSGPTDRPPTGAARSGVDGEWVGTDGVAVSSLNNGAFASRSAKTGETLTNGTYTFRDAKTIDLNFFSVKSQQSTQATCLLVDQNQMNCTLASGTQFVLTRKLA